ncbi:predicted protein [Uncinocarpus reesii 1704]|uniref:BTB domain-containing protein n=1 Tax=Uncinocarpus reesii (strain UAMH 1704) TaxID=336963 RepID=C4JJ14_UNCRE|nr:uncharacterized protein UREG_01621 [Uncinocarpus reesii 1704]EEP76772.1 predicted protein [Uncinocarpus reesii 1704]
MAETPAATNSQDAHEGLIIHPPMPSTESQASDEKSSNANISLTLSRSKARKLKRRIKACEDGSVEDVAKQDIQVYSQVKKMWLKSKSNRRNFSHCMPYGNEVNDDEGDAQPENTPAKQDDEVQDNDIVSGNASSNTKANEHGKQRKNKCRAKSQSNPISVLKHGDKKNSKEQVDLTEDKTKQSVDDDTTNEDATNEGKSNSSILSSERRRTLSQAPPSLNEDGTTATSCTLQALNTGDSQNEKEPCERTIFCKNGIVFGHYSDPSSGTVSSHPPRPSPHSEQEYHQQVRGPYDQAAPRLHFPGGWAQHSDPYQQSRVSQPHNPKYCPPFLVPEGYYGAQYPYPLHNTACAPYNDTERCAADGGQHSHQWPYQRPVSDMSHCPVETVSDLDGLDTIRINRQARQPLIQRDITPKDRFNMLANGTDRPLDFDTGRITAVPTRVQGNADANTETRAIISYLLRAFKSGLHSDYKLSLQSKEEHIPPLHFNPHSLIMWRNPHLNTIMKNIEKGQFPREINIVAETSFTIPAAFDIALQNLYGAPLMTKEQMGKPEILAVNWGCQVGDVARMNFALSYLSSGAFLANRNIIASAIRMIKSILDWNTLETLVHFGFATNQYLIGCSDEFARDRESDSDSSNDESIDTVEDFDINGNHREPQPDNPFLSKKTLNLELVHKWGPKLLKAALKFVAAEITPDFTFHPSARTAIMPDRLGWPQEASYSSIESAAADITWHKNRAVSATLIALPYKHLRLVFDFMAAFGNQDIDLARAVVAQRESRRMRTLRKLQLNGGDEEYLLPTSDVPLGWEEVIVEQGQKMRLAREWKGASATVSNASPDPESLTHYPGYS